MDVPRPNPSGNVIQKAVEGRQALTGVALFGPGESEAITLNNDHHYPMQSVYKFHLALAVLDNVDPR